MVVMPCGECGNAVSTKAQACPHCGAPPPIEPAEVQLLGEQAPPPGTTTEPSEESATMALPASAVRQRPGSVEPIAAHSPSRPAGVGLKLFTGGVIVLGIGGMLALWGGGDPDGNAKTASLPAPVEHGKPAIRFATDSGSVYNRYEGLISTVRTLLPGDSVWVIPSAQSWLVVTDSAGGKVGYVERAHLGASRPSAAELSAWKTSREQRAARAAQEQAEARRRDAAAKAAAERAAAEKRAEQKVLLSRISKRRDEMQGVTWYHGRGSEDWNQFAAYAYVGDNGSRWMKFFLGTRTESWLFWDEVIFNVDGRTITISDIDYPEKESDVGYGNVREWAQLSVPGDVSVTDLRAIATGSRVRVRFTGKYYHDYTLGEADKRRLRDILDFYEQGLSK